MSPLSIILLRLASEALPWVLAVTAAAVAQIFRKDGKAKGTALSAVVTAILLPRRDDPIATSIRNNAQSIATALGVEASILHPAVIAARTIISAAGIPDDKDVSADLIVHALPALLCQKATLCKAFVPPPPKPPIDAQ